MPSKKWEPGIYELTRVAPSSREASDAPTASFNASVEARLLDPKFRTYETQKGSTPGFSEGTGMVIDWNDMETATDSVGLCTKTAYLWNRQNHQNKILPAIQNYPKVASPLLACKGQ